MKNRLASPDVTAILLAWRAGDARALDRLLPLVYDELHRMARRQLRHEQRNLTLQPTALVNEVYLKLLGAQQVRWQDRSHFLALAARLMRRVLVDAARARQYRKRGGGAERVTLDPGRLLAGDRPPELAALDSALDALEQEDPRKCRVVELRYFGGLDVEETAAALNISVATVVRDWKLARTWLLRELRKERRLA